MKYPINFKGKTKKQVTKLNLSGLGLKEFPENVFDYPNLTKLVLSSNKIKVIPKDILKLNAYSDDTRSPIPMISVHLVGNLQYRRQS